MGESEALLMAVLLLTLMELRSPGVSFEELLKERHFHQGTWSEPGGLFTTLLELTLLN